MHSSRASLLPRDLCGNVYQSKYSGSASRSGLLLRLHLLRTACTRGVPRRSVRSRNERGEVPLVACTAAAELLKKARHAAYVTAFARPGRGTHRAYATCVSSAESHFILASRDSGLGVSPLSSLTTAEASSCPAIRLLDTQHRHRYIWYRDRTEYIMRVETRRPEGRFLSPGLYGEGNRVKWNRDTRN